MLDGGFPAWAADGLPVDTSPVTEDQMSAPAKAAAAPHAASQYRATLNVSRRLPLLTVCMCGSRAHSTRVTKPACIRTSLTWHITIQAAVHFCQAMATAAEDCSHVLMVSQKGLVRSAQQLLDNIDSQQEGVVDARSPGRFEGSAPEPRPGMPSGHIPGSRNVPFSEVLSPDGRCARGIANTLGHRCDGAAP